MERLRGHPLLDFKLADGNGRYIAEWEHLLFHGNDRLCWEIRGSIHRFYQGGSNWQDFTRTDFNKALDLLCNTFSLHDASLSLRGLENGVNVVPPIPTAQLLELIVLHKTKRPTWMNGQAVGISFFHGKKTASKGSNFRLKSYDKAHEFGLEWELMRLEAAHRQMRLLRNRFGLHTAADLRSLDAWHNLGLYLLERFDELLIVEPNLDLSGLRASQMAIVQLARDPGRLLGLDYSTRHRKLAALERIYSERAEPRLKGLLRSAIEEKIADLCQSSSIGLNEARHEKNAAPDFHEVVREAPLMVKGDFIPGIASDLCAEVGTHKPLPNASAKCFPCSLKWIHYQQAIAQVE